MNDTTDKIFAALEEKLPDFFSRGDAAKYLNGLMSYHTLAKHDSNHTGPPSAIVLGKVVYLKAEFLEWLRFYDERRKNAKLTR